MPDGLVGRFALLLTAALVAATLVAAGVLAWERDRLGREALERRQVERVLALVPALDGISPAERRRLLAASGRRGLAIATDLPPPATGRLADLSASLSEARGREIRVVRDSRRGPATVAAAVYDPPAWIVAPIRGGRPPRGAAIWPLLLVLGLSLAAVLGVGLVFLRRLTRPLADLAAAARVAGHGDRAARVPERGARELREAAQAFNDMQARIARFDAERTRTLAALGHDLRTPITSLRIRAEMLDEAEGAPMIATLDEMAVMADGLLAVARGEGEAEPRGDVALADLLRRLCEQRGAELIVDAEPVVHGRPVALTRAIGNLVDNALRYGGEARVRLYVDGGEAVVAVEDDGPGIPEDRLVAMFEPFVRGEASRNAGTGGAGLGLAIARAVARAHGGTVMLQNRPAGGLQAKLRLPVE